ncbi:MAG: Flp family type IVb pilin [Rhodospirillales bacterium]|jgi:pilus assembly protein Flp/PilA|nr:Flp family type IVb pilin [Rhodospirillales bacterium]
MAKKVIGRLRSLWKDEAGVTAIEYGLIAALIAVIIITAVSIVGTDLRNMFNTIAASI